jgi:hypothetical protein
MLVLGKKLGRLGPQSEFKLGIRPLPNSCLSLLAAPMRARVSRAFRQSGGVGLETRPATFEGDARDDGSSPSALHLWQFDRRWMPFHAACASRPPRMFSVRAWL